MGNLNFNRCDKRGVELPWHAYHPNASFRFESRKPYIARPKAVKE